MSVAVRLGVNGLLRDAFYSGGDVKVDVDFVLAVVLQIHRNSLILAQSAHLSLPLVFNRTLRVHTDWHL